MTLRDTIPNFFMIYRRRLLLEDLIFNKEVTTNSKKEVVGHRLSISRESGFERELRLLFIIFCTRRRWFSNMKCLPQVIQTVSRSYFFFLRKVLISTALVDFRKFLPLQKLMILRYVLLTIKSTLTL